MSPETNDPYYVLLADVVHSRDIERRADFESRLAATFESLNREKSDVLATPLSPMKGLDEFGCVLTAVAPVVDVILGILNATHPVSVRFAVANGGIDVGLGRDTVAEMDGPAFHRASELLEQLKENDLRVAVDTGSSVDALAATSLNFLTLQRMSLTSRQLEVVRAYDRHGTQPDAANELDISQQAVSKTLRDVDYRRLAALEELTRAGLKETYDD